MRRAHADRRADARRARDGLRRRAVSISWMMRLPITTASACAATARALAASRMPKPTPTGSVTCCADLRRACAPTSRGVEVAGAGHALERHVVDVAARDARDLRRCARRCEVGASRKIGSMPCARQQRGELLALPRAGSRRRARRRRRRRVRAVDERARTPIALDRIGVAHQHDRRLRRRAGGTARPVASTSRQADAVRQRALARRAGSPGRRPSGRRTARRARSRRRRRRPARA